MSSELEVAGSRLSSDDGFSCSGKGNSLMMVGHRLASSGQYGKLPRMREMTERPFRSYFEPASHYICLCICIRLHCTHVPRTCTCPCTVRTFPMLSGMPVSRRFMIVEKARSENAMPRSQYRVHVRVLLFFGARLRNSDADPSMRKSDGQDCYVCEGKRFISTI